VCSLSLVVKGLSTNSQGQSEFLADSALSRRQMRKSFFSVVIYGAAAIPLLGGDAKWVLCRIWNEKRRSSRNLA
jgi:hypothetical protein